jgi:hypothetical protein
MSFGFGDSGGYMFMKTSIYGELGMRVKRNKGKTVSGRENMLGTAGGEDLGRKEIMGLKQKGCMGMRGL